MKSDSIWTIVAGILLALLVLLVFEGLFFHGDLAITMISAGAFAVFLWLYAYRIRRRIESD